MLSGKVALVTGSTSGIGLGIARALAADGAHILLNGFGDHALIDKLITELSSRYNVKVGHSAADMSQPAEIAAMVDQAARELGGVDILVSNAGIQHVAPAEDFPVDKLDALIAINLSAAFHAIRTALPHMKARKWGRIVNVASTHGLVASVHKAAYVPHRSTASWDSPRWWRSRPPPPASHATRSVPGGCSRRWFKSRSTTSGAERISPRTLLA